MSIKQEENYTRKAFIADAVEIFKRNNPEKWIAFQNLVKERRQNQFNDFGQLKKYVNGVEKVDEDDIRIAITLPSELNNVFTTILSADDEGDFPKDTAELRWFMRKFPEFVIPKKI